jgi:hypothetical protein
MVINVDLNTGGTGRRLAPIARDKIFAVEFDRVPACAFLCAALRDQSQFFQRESA